MAIPLALLGFFRDGTTEYGAARARTDGTWHLVRKQYGDNSSAYSYARFTTAADYAAAKATPGAVAWQLEPFSSVDYTLLLAGLVSPLPMSTTAAGAIAAAVSAGSTDVGPVVQAVSAGNQLLAQMLLGQSTPGNRASEATLGQVLAALLGTLQVGVSGAVTLANQALAVTGEFFPATQAVSGPLTDGQLRAAPFAVTLPSSAATAQGQADTVAQLASVNARLGGALTLTLPAGAATASAQAAGNGLLADVKALLATPSLAASAATSASQLIGNTSLNSIDGKLTGAATAAKQDAQQVALAAIQANTAAAATATQQTAANTYLGVMAGAAGPQPASAYNLISLAGNNAKSVRTGATWLLGGSITNTASAFRYLLLYDLAAAPVSGNVPLMTLAIEPGRTVMLPVPAGRYVPFPTGLALAGGTASALGALSTVVAVVGTSTGLAAGELVVNLAYAS